jgi:hypothetical protein
MYRKIVFLFLVLVLAACQGGPLFHLGPTPTPFPDEFTGKVKLGDFTLTMQCQGSGEPTVILERGPWQDKGWSSYDSINLKEITRTCYYERIGTSTWKSDITVTGPRTVMDQVKDLHAILQQTGVPGPYILASFTLAAYNLILYNQQYPYDIAGLIAISPWYPTYYDYALEKLGPVTTGTSDEKKQRIEYLGKYKEKTNPDLFWKNHPEFLDQQASELQVLKVASLNNVPLTIIESENWWNDYQDPSIYQAVWEAIQQSNKDFCKLSSNCQMVKVPNTDPTSVVRSDGVKQAIQQMVDHAKD